MNKLLLLVQLAFFLSCLPLFSQSENLDTTFGTNGKVITSVNSGDDVAMGVALQSDGKIVVAGYTFDSVFGYNFLCIRYNTDGSLDTTFGNGGIATFDLQTGSDDRAFSVDIQLDGKIVLAGFSDDGSDRNGAVVRLNTNGTLDSSFSSSGIAITNVYKADIYKVVKIHKVTGNIIVGGASYEDTNESNGIIARYLPNGYLDSTFNGSGFISALNPVINSNAQVIELVIEDIAIKSNGRITAVGWVNNLASSFPTSDHYQCRINSNGTPDTTFSEDGYDFDVYTTGWDRTLSIHLYPDDSFIISGYTQWTSTDYRTYIADTPASGISGNSVDEWIQLSTTTRDISYGMDLDSSGNIYIGGQTSNNNTNSSSFYLSRVTNNGNDNTLDTSFGNAGYITTLFGNNSGAFDLKVQPDDKIVLVGYTDNDIALARYNSNSSLSTDEFKSKNSLSVYPNPANSTLNIKFNNTLINKKFKILDLNGKILVSGILEKDIPLNIKNLSKGVYIIKVGNINTKFIKI